MDGFFGFGSGFGDPFAVFGNFGRPGSLISSIYGGRDPFDDPFFTRPFGRMFGLDMFGASPFGSLAVSPFGFLEDAGHPEEHQPPPPKKSRGPIIHEITSDGEEEEAEEEEEGEKGKKEGSRKHPRSNNEPYPPAADEKIDEKRRRQMLYANNSSSSSHGHHPQAHMYTFQSTKVTYGGPNSAYYTSSTTRKTGGNGVIIEESKEADTTTRKATHMISRGLHDKAHSVTRTLNSDGRVDTMQRLYNLNQDELPGFEREWKGNAKKHIPGWDRSLDMLENGDNLGQSSSSGGGRSTRQAWALPSTVQQHQYIPERRTRGVPPRTFPTNPSNKRA